MLDDLSSGVNIAKKITLDKELNDSLRSTQAEMTTMLNNYNDYLFHPHAKEQLCNPNMLLRLMEGYQNRVYPDVMNNMNVKTDDVPFLKPPSPGLIFYSNQKSIIS